MEFKLEKLEGILNRVLTQFKDKPRYVALLNSYGKEFEELEAVFYQLQLLKDIDTQEGEQLITIGLIVGEPYIGQTDEDFRVALRARILTNNFNAKAEEILSIFTGDHFKIRDAKFTLRSVTPKTETEAAYNNKILQRIKGGGIGADYQYSGYATVDQYQLDINARGDIVNDEIASPEPNEFCCAVKADSYIWYVPQDGSYWLKLDPSDDTYVTYAKGFTGSMAHAAYDGTRYIWAVPDNSASIVRLDTVDGSVNTYAHGIDVEDQMFSTAVLVDNYIVAVPFNANYFVNINLTTLSVNTYAYGTGCSKFKSAIGVSPAGGDRVIAVPYNAPDVVTYIPSLATLLTTAHSETGSALWCKAYTDDTYVWMCPHYSDQFLKFEILPRTIAKTQFVKEEDEYLIDFFQYGNLLVYVPGKFGYWFVRVISTDTIIDMFPHKLDPSLVVAKDAIQTDNGEITGLGNLYNQYIIKFNPANFQSRSGYMQTQSIDHPFFNVTSNNGNNIYWAENSKSVISKINWKGSEGTHLTKFYRG